MHSLRENSAQTPMDRKGGGGKEEGRKKSSLQLRTVFYLTLPNTHGQFRFGHGELSGQEGRGGGRGEKDSPHYKSTRLIAGGGVFFWQGEGEGEEKSERGRKERF